MRKKFLTTLLVITVLAVAALVLRQGKKARYSEYYITPHSYQNYLEKPELSFQYVINNHEGTSKEYKVQALFQNQSVYQKKVSLTDGESFSGQPTINLTGFEDGSILELRINNESLWVHLSHKQNEIKEFFVSPVNVVKLTSGVTLVQPKVVFNISVRDNEPKNVTYKIVLDGAEIISETVEASKEFNHSVENTSFYVPARELTNIRAQIWANNALLDEKGLAEKPVKYFFLKAKPHSENLTARFFGDGYYNQTMVKDTVKLYLTSFHDKKLSFNLTMLNTTKKIIVPALSTKEKSFELVGFKKNEAAPLNIEMYYNNTLLDSFNYEINLSEDKTIFTE